MRRRSLIAMLIVLSSVPSALADTWPAKPIKAVVPFGPGSATDIIPRMVFEQLQTQLGQPIVVENRGGAGGTIGALQVVEIRSRCLHLARPFIGALRWRPRSIRTCNSTPKTTSCRCR